MLELHPDSFVRWLPSEHHASSSFFGEQTPPLGPDLKNWTDSDQPHSEPPVADLNPPELAGFVVTSHALREVLSRIDWPNLLLSELFASPASTFLQLDATNPNQLRGLAQHIRAALEQTPFLPELQQPLASTLARLLQAAGTDAPPMLRLSPGLTVAGLERTSDRQAAAIAQFRLDSFFDDCVVAASAAALEQGLKQLWTQLWSAKSLFYWQRVGIAPHHLQMTIVVRVHRSSPPGLSSAAHPAAHPVTHPTTHPAARPEPSPTHWTGIAAAGGQVQGPVQILTALPTRSLAPGTILVADQIPLTSLYLLSQSAGVVLEQGGLTSHAVIVARELGIPAVVGVGQITQHLKTGDRIALDGSKGHVQRQLGPAVWALPSRVRPAIPPPGPSALPCWISLSQISHLQAVHLQGCAGIGLLRGEGLLSQILETRSLPQALQHPERLTQNIAEQLQRCLAMLRPDQHLFYRAADLPGRDAQGSTGPQALSDRGSSLIRQNPALFEVELQALAQVMTPGAQVRLVLPFVRTLEEVEFGLDRVRCAGLGDRLPVWIMAEVPSVLFALGEYAEAGIGGLVVGCNDLTQLLLGADRQEQQFNPLFQPLHPVVQRAIAQLLQSAQALDLPCLLAAQAHQLPDPVLQRLVEQGLAGLVVPPQDLTQIQHRLALLNPSPHS
jgi:phosphoenolpyruvate synthase/pyruvate phosphate dikinase